MLGVCPSLISLNLIDRMAEASIVQSTSSPEPSYCHAKVFKIYGQFDDHSLIPQRFFRDFLAMLNTFMSMEGERMHKGQYHGAAWPSHGNIRRKFCYFFTFAGPDYNIPDLECEILCANFARRLTHWIRNELALSYPQVMGVWCLPLFNYLDESTRYDD